MTKNPVSVLYGKAHIKTFYTGKLFFSMKRFRKL